LFFNLQIYVGGLPSVSNALGRTRFGYAAPTNEALIALALHLQWITLRIDCTDESSMPLHRTLRLR